MQIAIGIDERILQCILRVRLTGAASAQKSQQPLLVALNQYGKGRVRSCLGGIRQLCVAFQNRYTNASINKNINDNFRINHRAYGKNVVDHPYLRIFDNARDFGFYVGIECL